MSAASRRGCCAWHFTVLDRLRLHCTPWLMLTCAALASMHEEALLLACCRLACCKHCMTRRSRCCYYQPDDICACLHRLEHCSLTHPLRTLVGVQTEMCTKVSTADPCASRYLRPPSSIQSWNAARWDPKLRNRAARFAPPQRLVAGATATCPKIPQLLLQAHPEGQTNRSGQCSYALSLRSTLSPNAARHVPLVALDARPSSMHKPEAKSAAPAPEPPCGRSLTVSFGWSPCALPAAPTRAGSRSDALSRR